MSYYHLSSQERYVISYLVLTDLSLREIGRRKKGDVVDFLRFLFNSLRKKGDVVDFLRFLFNSLCHDCCMPLKDRIDAPGALQHIICLDIDCRKIATGTADENNFAAHLGRMIFVRLFNG